MRIGLMTPGLGTGDAVGNDVLGMHRALVAAGYDVPVFANSASPDVSIPTLNYGDLSWRLDQMDDTVIYHYCTGDPLALKALLSFRGNIVLKYHNVTPSQFFRGYSPEFTMGTLIGRELLPEFLELPLVHALADSSFNREELLGLGVMPDAVSVIPPFHRIERLLQLNPDPTMSTQLRANRANLLVVGRVVPNKGLDLLIFALERLSNRGIYVPDLHFVGSSDPRLSIYHDALKAILSQTRLEHLVHFHGAVSDEVLVAMYKTADLLWIGSQHEGFCVPAVEAMAFGLPIVSTAISALPETCGDCAAYCAQPEDFAETTFRILSDDVERLRRARRGRGRFETTFRSETIERTFIEFIEWLERHLSGPGFTPDLRQVDWFGLPQGADFAEQVLGVWDDRSGFRISGRARRLDLIEWALRMGRFKSAEVRGYFSSEDFNNYIARLSMGQLQERLSPLMRFLWTISREAHARFDLASDESVREYSAWYFREGIEIYRLWDLLDPVEQRFIQTIRGQGKRTMREQLEVTRGPEVEPRARRD